MSDPSYYRVSETPNLGLLQSMSDNSLRIGRILKAYDVGTDQCRNKRVIEYDVEVKSSNGIGQVADIIYPRVKVASLFGGATDFFRWTPRIENFDKKTQIGFGSRVLLLCINGNQKAAYIIGGIPHPEDGAVELPYTDNHHMEFQFNGIYANVDKEGSFTMIHRGATNADDSIKDTAGTNSSIQFNSNGDITLGYNLTPPTKDSLKVTPNSDDLPYIGLYKKDKEITVYSPSDIHSITNKKYLIQTSEGVKVNPTGENQQAWLRATAYREKQSEMNNTLKNLFKSLATILDTVSNSLLTASAAMKPPVGGSTAGSVPIQAAAQTLSGAVQMVKQMGSAIGEFESSSSEYLSPSHFHADKV